MARQKGDSTTHVYSDRGKSNHDQITWASTVQEKCKHLRYIGKRRKICLRDPKATCPVNSKTCPVMSGEWS